MGVPELQGYNKERVAASNAAAEFILGELRLHQSRGGTSGRENPANSLHWYTLTEVGMFKQGTWWDKYYDACTFQGREGRGSAFAMMSRKSDFGRTCVVGMCIISRSGSQK